MEKYRHLNDAEVEMVKKLQEQISISETQDEAKKYYTEMALIVERARAREIEAKHEK